MSIRELTLTENNSTGQMNSVNPNTTFHRISCSKSGNRKCGHSDGRQFPYVSLFCSLRKYVMTLWTETSKKDRGRGQYFSALIYFTSVEGPVRAIYVTDLSYLTCLILLCVTSLRLQLTQYLFTEVKMEQLYCFTT
jgi:hypothetical protein